MRSTSCNLSKPIADKNVTFNPFNLAIARSLRTGKFYLTQRKYVIMHFYVKALLEVIRPVSGSRYMENLHVTGADWGLDTRIIF